MQSIYHLPFVVSIGYQVSVTLHAEGRITQVNQLYELAFAHMLYVCMSCSSGILRVVCILMILFEKLYCNSVCSSLNMKGMTLRISLPSQPMLDMQQ